MMGIRFVTDHDRDAARPARLPGLHGHGIARGNPAHLVVRDAESPEDAIAAAAHPRRGCKGGRPTFTRGAPQPHRPWL